MPMPVRERLASDDPPYVTQLCCMMAEGILHSNRSCLAENMPHVPSGAPVSLRRQRESSRRADRVVGAGSGESTPPLGATAPWAVVVSLAYPETDWWSARG